MFKTLNAAKRPVNTGMLHDTSGSETGEYVVTFGLVVTVIGVILAFIASNVYAQGDSLASWIESIAIPSTAALP